MYSTDDGVAADAQKAATYIEESAKIGKKEAQGRLGYTYNFGLGVKQDFQQAAYWYQKAVDQGDMWSATYLASLFINGEAASSQGTLQNDQRAFALISKAAHAEIPTAVSGIAWMFENGRGVTRDPFPGPRLVCRRPECSGRIRSI